MKRITLGQVYTNSTRPQKVEISFISANEIEYKVIEATSQNPINHFYCSKERFLRLYRL